MSDIFQVELGTMVIMIMISSDPNLIYYTFRQCDLLLVEQQQVHTSICFSKLANDTRLKIPKNVGRVQDIHDWVKGHL